MAKTKLTFRNSAGKRTSGDDWRTGEKEDRKTRSKRDSKAKSDSKKAGSRARKIISKMK